LITDGRIQPAKIEEKVAEAQKKLIKQLKKLENKLFMNLE